MKKIMNIAQAGSMESSDAIVTVAPAEAGSGINIDLQSSVILQYGEAIRAVVEQTIKEQGIVDAQVKVVDRGALDYTLKSRTQAALARGGVELVGVSAGK